MKTAKLTRLASVVCLFHLYCLSCLAQDTIVLSRIGKPGKQLYLPTRDFTRTEIFTLPDGSKVEAVLLSVSDSGFHLLVEPSEYPDSLDGLKVKWWPRVPHKKARFNMKYFTESRIIPVDSVTCIYVRDFPYKNRRTTELILTAGLYAADISIFFVPLPATLIIIPTTFVVCLGTMYKLKHRRIRLGTKWQIIH